MGVRMNEVPVKINNRNNKHLYGIVHIPEEGKLKNNRKIGIHIIVPGIKYRVAPNRLSVKIARKLCEMGFYVLRADPEGVGDSDGELGQGKAVKTLFVEIQNGLFVNDTISWSEHFTKKYQLDEIVLLGNCGGAVTALLSWQEAKCLNLILIDPPIVFSEIDNFQKVALRGGEYSDSILRSYLSKLLKPEYWIRILTFKSDIRLIFNLITMKIKNKTIKYLKRGEAKKNKGAIPSHTESGEKIITSLYEKFYEFKQKDGSSHFICAEFDPGRPLLEEYFIKKVISADKRSDTKHQYSVIKDGNHIYTDISSQDALFQAIQDRLKECYC